MGNTDEDAAPNNVLSYAGREDVCFCYQNHIRKLSADGKNRVLYERDMYLSLVPSYQNAYIPFLLIPPSTISWVQGYRLEMWLFPHCLCLAGGNTNAPTCLSLSPLKSKRLNSKWWMGKGHLGSRDQFHCPMHKLYQRVGQMLCSGMGLTNPSGRQSWHWRGILEDLFLPDLKILVSGLWAQGCGFLTNWYRNRLHFNPQVAEPIYTDCPSTCETLLSRRVPQGGVLWLSYWWDKTWREIMWFVYPFWGHRWVKIRGRRAGNDSVSLWTKLTTMLFRMAGSPSVEPSFLTSGFTPLGWH